MDEQQSQKVKAIDDQQTEGVRGKRPYKTPTLKKLGSLEQLTQGIPNIPVPDDFETSV
ncbi:MAG: PIG-S family GPI transamidase component [Candidatus Brocadiaceae bacterium]|nr:PIG-S family GPI transamidase component [Candidatus Brocadiaceae bacterium]